MDDPIRYELNIFYSTNNAPNDTLTIALIGPKSDLPLNLLKYPRSTDAFKDTFKLYGLWHTYDGVVENAREIFSHYLADRVRGFEIELDDPIARQRLLAAQDKSSASEMGKVWATVQGERAMLYEGSLDACYAWAHSMRDNPNAAGLEVIDDAAAAHMEAHVEHGDPLAMQEVWSQ